MTANQRVQFLTEQLGGQSERRTFYQGRGLTGVNRKKRRRRFPFCVNFAEVSPGRDGQSSRKFPPRWSPALDMAPSARLKEAIADVHEGIRAILLGPPGAGKGTQVRGGANGASR